MVAACVPSTTKICSESAWRIWAAQVVADTRRKFGEAVCELLLAHYGELSRRRIALVQIKHCWMIQMRTDDALQRRMDLGQ